MCTGEVAGDGPRVGSWVNALDEVFRLSCRQLRREAPAPPEGAPKRGGAGLMYWDGVMIVVEYSVSLGEICFWCFERLWICCGSCLGLCLGSFLGSAVGHVLMRVQG